MLLVLRGTKKKTLSSLICLVSFQPECFCLYTREIRTQLRKDGEGLTWPLNLSWEPRLTVSNITRLKLPQLAVILTPLPSKPSRQRSFLSLFFYSLSDYQKFQIICTRFHHSSPYHQRLILGHILSPSYFLLFLSSYFNQSFFPGRELAVSCATTGHFSSRVRAAIAESR